MNLIITDESLLNQSSELDIVNDKANHTHTQIKRVNNEKSLVGDNSKLYFS